MGCGALRPGGATAAIAFTVVLSGGCGGSEDGVAAAPGVRETVPVADTGRPFAGSAGSPRELGTRVVRALVRADTAALERVRLSEHEHNDIVWPELPAARPEVNFPVAFAWENIERRNRREVARLLPRYRSRRLVAEGVECRGALERFETFQVHTGCVVRLRSAGGEVLEAALFDEVVERNGGFKIFRYSDAPPRSAAARAAVSHSAMFEGAGGEGEPKGAMDEIDLIYDWNRAGGEADWSAFGPVELDDETLRDGLQSPSVVDPTIEDKIRLLHLMDELGIHAADIGLPGAGPRAVEAVRALAREIVEAGLAIRPNCAARTMLADVRPIAELSQEVGVAVEAATFIGSSPIRRYAEEWTLDRMLRTAEEAVTFAVGEGLPVMFVTEDSTRARPETLEALYRGAVEWGARRLCLADTVGHATPAGAYALVRFLIEEVVEPSGEDVTVDWHGHRDRGFGLANSLAAVRAGAGRVHGTALGVGERVGNTEMELLLVNLALLGLHDGDLTPLPEYARLASEACQVPLPPAQPVVGRDAFRTATGVHAAAIVKAERKGDAWLADRIYSGVPAGLVGRAQEIEVGPMSGLSNVRHWLGRHGHDPDDEALCRRLLEAAKAADRVFTEAELEDLVVDA